MREGSPANSLLAANYDDEREGSADTVADAGHNGLQAHKSSSAAASGVALAPQGSAALPADFFQQVGLGKG